MVTDSVDHQLQCRIDDGAGFLWVEVFDQLHRTLDVVGHLETGHRRPSEKTIAKLAKVIGFSRVGATAKMAEPFDFVVTNLLH